MAGTRFDAAALGSFSLKVLQRQQLLIAIGVAIWAIFWVVGHPGPIVVTLVYTLLIGNVSLPAMTGLDRLLVARRFPYNWLLYLSLLAAVSFVSAIVADALEAWWLARFGFPTSYWLHSDLSWAGRVALIVQEPAWLFTFIVGVVYYFYSNTRSGLERRNFELQQAVHSGMTALERQEQELQKAREIQEGLLPKEFPRLKGLEIAWGWQPARVVGGDYFDVIRFSDRHAAVCVADVAGKGITAALLMANLQAAVRAFAVDSTSSAALCQKLNTVICENTAQDKFITFFYALLDGETRTIAFTNAGHCPPLVLRRGGQIRLENGGALLGIFPEWNYSNAELKLESGDRILLFTDGLTEAMNTAGEEFGEQRLIECARLFLSAKPADLQARILAEVAGFCGGKFHDDATLVVLGVK